MLECITCTMEISSIMTATLALSEKDIGRKFQPNNFQYTPLKAVYTMLCIIITQGSKYYDCISVMEPVVQGVVCCSTSGQELMV